MIRQLGTHRGKQIIFGFDRHVLPDLDGYKDTLSRYGAPAPGVVFDELYYLTSAERTCRRVQHRPDRVGVLICSTGMGMSIAANKFRGIYAVRCLTVEDAQLARTINNANVLCLATRAGFELNQDIVAAFMTTPYEGRKLDKLEYIATMELEADPAPSLPRRGKIVSSPVKAA
ncbi:MAG: RpiB/LacA/LacB family sugar-phosphate isomerase [Proteobacteria bacterium]|nr:RpiB/LacA/LacB family sugar-phosphate isomerase [Pseudomonadota bacterium]